MRTEPTTSNRFAPVVLAPTFNNAATLGDILKRIEQLQRPERLAVIVINDGSTDSTLAVLREFPEVMVLTHATNRGKAAALQSGFGAAACKGFTHAVTIDTDGQHEPEQIPQFLTVAEQSPAAIVLGTRDTRTPGYPWLSRFGRRFSNALVWLESGLRVADSQCGLRVYPLRLIRRIECSAGRYGFETEILTRAAWERTAVVEQPVACWYTEVAGLVSHFDPIVDSLRALAMHGRLLCQALPRWPRRIAAACNPVAAWRRLRATPEARNEFAGGLALGVFFACLPLYGVQGVLSFLAARVLKVSGLSAIAGSQLSMPPLSAVLIAASLACGHLVLHGTWPAPGAWHAAQAPIWSLATLRTVLLDWMVGGMVVGAALSMVTYLAVRATLAAGEARSA